MFKKIAGVALAALMVISTGSVNAYAAEPTSVTLGEEGNTTTLNEGKYSVPVSMMNASNINNASMAGGCLSSEGVIEVNADGTVDITLTLQTLTIMGTIKGNASELKYYSEYNTTSTLNDVEVLSTRTAVYTAFMGENADGLEHETVVPEKVSFTIPVLNQSGFYISTTVDAMGYSPDAYVLVDYASAVEIIDRTELNSLVDTALEFTADEYTEDSFNALQTAINNAKNVLDDETSTQFEIDEQVELLQTAIDGLQEIVNETEKETETEEVTDLPEDSNDDVPSTGDSSRTTALALIAIAGAFVIVVLGKKFKDETN